MEFLFWTSVFMIFYIYIGYPVLLYLISLFIHKPIIKSEVYLPCVSLIVSVFNEDSLIEEKIENTLSLDYPEDKLEIIFVSDCSTDNTDKIIEQYVSENFVLIKQKERKGKTEGLNKAVPLTRGEIIVFSDANAFYQKDSLKKLVRNFSDPTIGGVTGEAKYIEGLELPAERCEDKYWEYEKYLKTKETVLGSMVGGDGAIYAIRKNLYVPLDTQDISDFLNPLQIVSKGFRVVYEPEAVCYEEASGSFKKEFKRKSRIVSRSLKSTFKIPNVLNPFKTGIFSLQLLSHKLLRWHVPILLIIILISSYLLGVRSPGYKYFFFFQLAFYGLSLISPFLQLKSNYSYIPYYFCVVNYASFIGILNAYTGNVPAIWIPQRSEKIEKLNQKKIFSHNLSYILAIFIGIVLYFYLIMSFSIIAKIIFWTSLILILYVYFGYSVILIVLTFLKGQKITKKEVFPTVTLLITAHNEEKIIRKKIENSLSLDYPEDLFKITIASDGSTDRTNETVKEFLDKGIIFYPFSERKGKMATINSVFSSLDSEIVIFSDANVMIQKDSIRKLIRNFSDSSIGAVSGNVILLNEYANYGEGERLFYKNERFLQQVETKYESIIGVDGALYAIRRELYPHPSSDIILDDFVISMEIARNGNRVIYEPEAIAYEENYASFSQEFQRKVRIVAGGIQAIKKREGLPRFSQKRLLFEYISHKFLRWCIPLFILLLFCTSISLLNYGNIYLFAFLAFLLLFILTGSNILLKNENKFLTIPNYFCMVNIAALFGIIKGLLNKQKPTWTVIR